MKVQVFRTVSIALIVVLLAAIVGVDYLHDVLRPVFVAMGIAPKL